MMSFKDNYGDRQKTHLCRWLVNGRVWEPSNWSIEILECLQLLLQSVAGANPKIARKIRRPVWRIDHGEADQVVAVDLSKKMVAALLKKKSYCSL